MLLVGGANRLSPDPEIIMQFLKSLFLTSTVLAGAAASAHADVNVVASIKPVHSLVAAVMDGVSEPDLIVEGAGSPHNYALKPSQAQMLEDADLVFWVGGELETFLEKPVEALAADSQSVELLDAHDLIRLEFREGGAFERHAHGEGDDHGEHAEHGHDDHGHGHEETANANHDHDHEETAEAGHDGHDHDEHGHDEHGHDEHAGHDHGEFDAHIWLDPMNAKAMVHDIEEALIAADPDNAGTYEANAKALMAKLDTLVTEVTAELAPVADKGFIVFHDAYQYFENRFGIAASGSITVSPEVMPGAQRIAAIRARIGELGAKCVFAEPQFEPKLVETVIEGTQAKGGVIDPLGAQLTTGPDLYFELIRTMSASIKTCLSEAQ